MPPGVNPEGIAGLLMHSWEESNVNAHPGGLRAVIPGIFARVVSSAGDPRGGPHDKLQRVHSLLA